MGGIKSTAADKAFSKCIRAAAGWCCERCGKYYPEGIARAGLDCSHHHSRGNWGIRFNPLNAEALCYGCHSFTGGTQERREEVLSDDEQMKLWEMKRDTSLGKFVRKTKGVGPIAKHYRDELDRIEEKRASGFLGRIKINNWGDDD